MWSGVLPRDGRQRTILRPTEALRNSAENQRYEIRNALLTTPWHLVITAEVVTIWEHLFLF